MLINMPISYTNSVQQIQLTKYFVARYSNYTDLSTTGGVTHDKSVAVGGQGVLIILWGGLADPPPEV